MLGRLFTGWRLNSFLIRSALAGVILCVFAAALAFVAFSPWALRGLDHVAGMNWARLSDIGQTYTAAATFLSSLALAGVVLSLVIQNHEAKIAREQAIRSLHGELVRMGDDADLVRVVSGSRRDAAVSTHTRARQRRYANQWMVFWQTVFELRRISEEDLRLQLSKTFFSGDVGREYWHSARQEFIPDGNRRIVRFYRIVDDEYEKALALGPPEHVLPDGSGDDAQDAALSGLRRLTRPSCLFASGLLVGAVLTVTAGGRRAHAVAASSAVPRSSRERM